MCFRIEKELVETFTSVTPNFLFCQQHRKRRIKQFSEVQVGSVIPDLVYISLSPKKVDRGNVYLSELNCCILADLLENGPSDLDSISERLFCRSEKIESSLKLLQRYQIVVLKKEKYFSICKKTLKFNSQIVAVEAKLKNWKKAILQAKAYLQFAHISYVALPLELANRSKIIEQCKINGIGLIGVESQSSKSIYRPKSQKPNSKQAFWVMSKTIGL